MNDDLSDNDILPGRIGAIIGPGLPAEKLKFTGPSLSGFDGSSERFRTSRDKFKLHDVDAFLPGLENEDVRSDLNEISYSEGVVQAEYSVDADEFSRIASYCIHKSSDDHSLSSTAKRNKEMSDNWNAIEE